MRLLPGLAGVAAVLAAVLAGAQLYVSAADTLVYPALEAEPGVAGLTLIFHGSKDADNPVFLRLRSALQSRYPDQQVVYYNWAAGADNRLRARANALALGNQLGASLARLPELQTIHLVTHSSGAYVADALCERYKAQGGRASIRMTFLDPFGLAGMLDFSNGPRTHGRCAQFALAIINTDDPAPATNSPLQQAFTIDVTAEPGQSELERNGHYWPPVYYLGNLPELEQRFGAARHADFPRGMSLTP